MNDGDATVHSFRPRPGSSREAATCSFCNKGTDVSTGGDGVRIELSQGADPTKMVLWAHLSCLSEHLLDSTAEYLPDVFG